MRLKCLVARFLPLTAALLLGSLVSGAAAAPVQPIELELMANAWAQKVIDTIKDGLQRFEAANPGVTIRISTYSTADKFLVRYTSGTAPDLALVNLGNVGAFGEQGIIMALDDYIQKSGLRQQLVADMWNNGIWRNKTYGVPAVEQGPRLGWVWNMDAVDEAGLAVNSNSAMTWDTFFNYADKLTKIDGNGVITRLGYEPRIGQNSRLFTNAPLWNAPYFPLVGNPALNHPNLIQMVDTIAQRIYGKYPSWKSSTAWYDYFVAGKTAVTNLGIYGPGEIETRSKDIRYKIGWPPSLDGRKIQQLTGWLLAIPTGVKHPDLSFKLIEFMSTDVQFQMDLYSKVGYLGSGNRFISRLVSEVRDPNRLWYVQSMSQAELIDAPRPDPLVGIADTLFKTAAENVWTGKQAAPAALEEANRLFVTELQKAGRL